MAKSLERLLLDRYLATRCLKGLLGDLLQAIDHVNHIINERASENFDAAMQNEALANILHSGNRSVVETRVKLPNFS